MPADSANVGTQTMEAAYLAAIRRRVAARHCAVERCDKHRLCPARWDAGVNINVLALTVGGSDKAVQIQSCCGARDVQAAIDCHLHPCGDGDGSFIRRHKGGALVPSGISK